jgi:hypothetical protein
MLGHSPEAAGDEAFVQIHRDVSTSAERGRAPRLAKETSWIADAKTEVASGRDARRNHGRSQRIGCIALAPGTVFWLSNKSAAMRSFPMKRSGRSVSAQISERSQPYAQLFLIVEPGGPNEDVL